MKTFLSGNYSLKAEQSCWWELVVSLFLVVIEMFWLVPWYRKIMEFSTVPTVLETALVFSLIMFLSYLFAQWFGKFSDSLPVQQIGLSVWFMIGLWFSIKILLDLSDSNVLSYLAAIEPEVVLVFFAVLWLWWRGLSLERDLIHPSTVWQRFQFGILMFMAYLVISHGLQSTEPGFLWFALFLFIGFLAVIYTRVSYVGGAKGVQKNPFDRKWLIFSSVIIGFLVMAAVILGGVFSGQNRQVLEFFLGIIKVIITIFVFLVALPSLIVSVAISPFIAWLSQFVGMHTIEQPAQDTGIGAYPIFQDVPDPQRLPVQIESFIFWGAILFFLFLLFSRMRKIIRAKTSRTADGPESLLTKGEAGAIFRKTLQDTLDKLTARLSPLKKHLASAYVRRIYSALLDLCQELGHPRPVYKTPNEFLPTIEGLMPSLKDELLLITNTYIGVRYGDYPETKQEIQMIEAAWQRILENGKHLKKSGGSKIEILDSDKLRR